MNTVEDGTDHCHGEGTPVASVANDQLPEYSANKHGFEVATLHAVGRASTSCTFFTTVPSRSNSDEPTIISTLDLGCGVVGSWT